MSPPRRTRSELGAIWGSWRPAELARLDPLSLFIILEMCGLLLFAASAIINVDNLINPQKRAVGFLDSINWVLNFGILAPLATAFSYAVYQEIPRTLPAWSGTGCFWIGNSSAKEPAVLKAWNIKQVFLFRLLCVSAIFVVGMALYRWWITSAVPLARGSLQGLPPEDHDWAVASCFKEDVNWLLNALFSFAASALQTFYVLWFCFFFSTIIVFASFIRGGGQQIDSFPIQLLAIRGTASSTSKRSWRKCLRHGTLRGNLPGRPAALLVRDPGANAGSTLNFLISHVIFGFTVLFNFTQIDELFPPPGLKTIATRAVSFGSLLMLGFILFIVPQFFLRRASKECPEDRCGDERPGFSPVCRGLPRRPRRGQGTDYSHAILADRLPEPHSDLRHDLVDVGPVR